MAKINYDALEALVGPVMDYAKDLSNSDRIRVAAYLLGSVNCAQQYATISNEAMELAMDQTNLFQFVEADDPMDPGYHLHNMLENLADEFETLAECVESVDTVAV